MTRKLALGILLVGAALLIGIGVTVGFGLALDKAAFHALAFRATVTPGWMIETARGVTRLGDPLTRSIALAAAALWLIVRRRLRDAGVLLATIGIGTTADSLLKEALARPRPSLVPHLDYVQSYSFPSGHAANSALILLSTALLLGAGRRWPVAMALALTLAIGMSRVMLGVHWPSDVLGGWLLGSGCALIGAALGSGRKPGRRANTA